MSFLPPDYSSPQGGNYMRFQIGENRFRVLAPTIVGNEFWITDMDGNRRPVRRRMDEVIHDEELDVDSHGKPERVRHFWAFPVWNMTAQQVQILEITQRTVQDAIIALNESPDWGDPMGYDIIVRKSGSGMETVYSVLPTKPTPLPANAQRAFLQSSINIEALFDGADPFAGGVKAAPPTQPKPPRDPSPMNYDGAVTLCKAVGIDKDTLVAHLKEHKLTGWNSEKCTPIVQALIAAQQEVSEPMTGGGSGGDYQAIPADDIPFAPDAFDGRCWRS